MSATDSAALNRKSRALARGPLSRSIAPAGAPAVLPRTDGSLGRTGVARKRPAPEFLTHIPRPMTLDDRIAGAVLLIVVLASIAFTAWSVL